MYVGLVADGSQLPFYVELHKNPTERIEFTRSESHAAMAVTGEERGSKSMLHYLEWARTNGYIKKGDVILLDNERALKTATVQEYAEDYGILLKYFPAYLGGIMNPCDNSFNSVFKSAYYKLMSLEANVTEKQKVMLAEEAYYKPSDKAMQRIFAHVGIIKRSPSDTADLLISEDCRHTAKSARIHKQQIKNFLEFAIMHNIDISKYRLHDM